MITERVEPINVYVIICMQVGELWYVVGMWWWWWGYEREASSKCIYIFIYIGV
jgi:hypothetical protein